MIVIMLRVIFVTWLSIDAAANTTDDLMLSWKWSPGQGCGTAWDRSGRSWEGPARGAEWPHERRSAARGRACWPVNDCWVRQDAGPFLLVGATAQTVALEFDAVSIVDDAVQNGVAEGRVGNDVVPLRHGYLTCDQERSFVVAIVDDLEKVAGLLGCKWLWAPSRR